MKQQRKSWLSKALGAGLLALVAVACTTETVPGPERGTEYYPVEVGDFRIYNVVDSIWNEDVPTATRFQFRERVTETFLDAMGKPVFRVVRSRRATATDNWRDDSVMLVNKTDQTVLVTKNNRRTVDLVFPIREGGTWNLNAYNPIDTIVAKNRSYARLGEPFEVSSGGGTYRYDATVTTVADDINLIYPTVWQQVYAKGVGPVYRVVRRYNYGCPPRSDSGCAFVPGYIKTGHSRTEVLVEYGG
ncbi:hypothetical protein LJY25_00300 [Hymenobacter sp. BT175]|uniref:hypothetical protein n=1 Tax=Hymenobacter translucens TaxID=2886507 RepID=UPI001D0E1A00|nr:hypothetical protein [Hymenobacter translucens]MCC2544869.1 hypothetical protein [Hymenobacter translucens]